MEDLKIIHEDEYVLVINKPSGLVVNRSQTTKNKTLQDIIDEKNIINVKNIKNIKNTQNTDSINKDSLTHNDVSDDKDDLTLELDEFSDDSYNKNYNVDDEFIARSGIAHRLDKDTSGVLVIAKTRESFKYLLRQFKQRKTHKQYYAVVHGLFEYDRVEINAPIKRNPNVHFKFAVVSEGKEAVSIVEKVKTFKIKDKDYSLISVEPKTGRTHQIRVHLASAGYPIAGDVIYCTRSLLEQDSDIFDRLMLHAHKISFYHPKTKEYVTYSAPLPSDFDL